MKALYPVLFAVACSTSAWGQSSSLYVTAPDAQATFVEDPFANVIIDDQTGAVGVRATPQDDTISSEMKRMSFAAVSLPDPRTYQLNDISTIIVRESTTATIDWLRSARAGDRLSATSRVVDQRGRNTIHDIEVLDQDGNRIAIVRGQTLTVGGPVG